MGRQTQKITPYSSSAEPISAHRVSASAGMDASRSGRRKGAFCHTIPIIA